MSEFLNFVLNFKHRSFRGRTGTIVLSSLAGALFCLGIWGLEQNLPQPTDYQPLNEVWLVIVPLSMLSGLLTFLNLRPEQEHGSEDQSDSGNRISNQDTPSIHSIRTDDNMSVKSIFRRDGI